MPPVKKRRLEAPPQRVPHKTSEEVLAALLDFVRRKFYEGHGVEFAKHKNDLLAWVILWPAAWLRSRGVSLPDEAYQKMLEDVLMDALRYGQTSKMRYPPAWLRQVIQSHFKINEDAIYAKAKSSRNLTDHALATLGKLTLIPTPTVVDTFAKARDLLLAAKKAAKEAVAAKKKQVVTALPKDKQVELF